MTNYKMILALSTVLLLFAASPVFALKITTDDLVVTFDEEHGGVLSSLKYNETEFLVTSGEWGTMGLVRSTYSTGDICTLWPSDMTYQYQQTAAISHIQNNGAHYVDVSTPIGTVKWRISKTIPAISLLITPNYPDEYIYIPFLKEGDLTFYTINGKIMAGETEYCIAPGYKTSLTQYKINSKKVSIFSPILFSPTSYYGYDTNSWLLHYPIYPITPLFFMFYE